MGKLKNQSGFSAIEGLLIVLVLAVIGFGGYYVWHTQRTNKSASTTTVQTKSTTTTDKSVSKQPVSNNVLTSADGKVQITLPTGWTVASRVDGGSTCGFAPTAPAPGTCITDISFAQGNKGGYVKIFKTTDTATAWHQATFGDCGSAQNSTVNGRTELICTLNPDGGKDYTISSGSYVAYFAGDNSSDFLTIVNSTRFF